MTSKSTGNVRKRRCDLVPLGPATTVDSGRYDSRSTREDHRTQLRLFNP